MTHNEYSSVSKNSKPILPKKNSDPKLGKTVTIATVIMMGSVFLSRITGLIREQVMAHFGGTGLGIDAYVTAFFIPEMLNHFLAGGFLSITFIPIFQRYIINGERDRGWKSFSNLFCIGTFFFLILIPLSMIFTPDILKLAGIRPDVKPHYFETTVRLTRIVLPAQLFFYWGAFFSAVQMAEKRFFIPAIAPLCYNGGIILGGIILGPRIGIDGFAWGVLFGAFLANMVVQLPGALKIGLKFYPRFNLSDPDLLEYVKKSIPLVLGLSMTFSNEIFFRFFSASLSEGTVASVNYALRVMMMVVAMFGQASGAAFFPFLSKLALEKKFDQMSDLLNSALSRIAALLLPISGIMIVLSQQIIAIIYQRGHFDHQSTLQTSSIFSVYLLGAFGFSASMIISRPFYAMQNTILPMVVNTLIALLSIPLYVLFSRRMGGPGIAFATTIAVTSQFIVLYVIWSSRHAQWKTVAKLVFSISKILLITSLGCALGYLLKQWGLKIEMQNLLLKNLTVCFISTIPSFLLVMICYELAGIQRFTDIIRKTKKRNG